MYATIIAVGLGTVSLVLPFGNRIAPAPEVPVLVAVEGSAVVCLGNRLVLLQSGVFLDVHAPDRDARPSADQPGSRIARGEIERGKGLARVSGGCAPGTPLTGRGFRAELVIGQPTEATKPDGGPIPGYIEVDHARYDFVVRSTAPDKSEAGGRRLQAGDLVSRLFLAVAVIIAVAHLVGSLFRRIHQPRVVGEIFAGILLGPSLLGLAFPSVTAFLFPPEVTEVLRILAQFGLVFFMFLVGLHLDLAGVAQSGRTAVLVSHVSIVAPFVLGVLSALLIYPRLGAGHFAAFALFMGAAMAITAFPVLARILTDTGLDKTALGTLAITCAAIDDLTAWCVLSVVVAIAHSSGAMGVTITMLQTGLLIAVMFLVVRPIASRIVGRSLVKGSLEPSVFVGLIVIVLLSGWMAEEIGIHVVFGAFVAGVILPRSALLASEVSARLDAVTSQFLLPVFFAVVGLSTRIGLLDRSALWAVTGLVMVVAVAGKLAGSTLAARACRVPWRDATALGVLMNARGLTEIVILTIGLNLGVITPVLFTIMVLMALATTFMATPLLARLLPNPVSLVATERYEPEQVGAQGS